MDLLRVVKYGHLIPQRREAKRCLRQKSIPRALDPAKSTTRSLHANGAPQPMNTFRSPSRLTHEHRGDHRVARKGGKIVKARDDVEVDE